MSHVITINFVYTWFNGTIETKNRLIARCSGLIAIVLTLAWCKANIKFGPCLHWSARLSQFSACLFYQVFHIFKPKHRYFNGKYRFQCIFVHIKQFISFDWNRTTKELLSKERGQFFRIFCWNLITSQFCSATKWIDTNGIVSLNTIENWKLEIEFGFIIFFSKV